MQTYIRNRACCCFRCRARGITGTVFLITLGVLFLLGNYNIIYFGKSWPVLLIVAGLCMLANRSSSTEGHMQPWETQGAIQQGDSQVKP
jgi:di/tricarboxylate transporter